MTTVNRIPPQKKSQDHSYVVGIGASAGGLEAIHELFDNMPDDTGFSFVIVQHLSPDYKSLMPELLAKHSQMKIYEVEDGMLLKKDCIYLMPSRKNMTVENGKLRLSEQQRNHLPNTAIDTFFTSLAKAKGKQAIAVILSGTGTDGSKGIEAIKEHGGIVVVQDPITAKFDGMPNSAISTGHADLILPPEMMAAELSDYLKETPLQKAFHDMNQKDEMVLRDILDAVLKITSYDFSSYKRPTIHRRLSKRMMLKGIHSMADYLKYLRNHPDEVHLLAQEFLIGVTKFFRDEEAFAEVQSKVIPAMFKSKKTKEPVKLWVVACSTGEEAYSLAMLIDEYFEKNNMADPGVKIFATDIDAKALATASKGVYSETIANDIPAKRLEKYFVKEANTYKVVPVIRKMIVFAQHDILKDPPFSRIDFISCRNMLIYMSPELQKNVFKTFHFALSQHGFLMLGPSENIGVLKDSVKEVSKKWKIFKCTGREKLLDYSFSAPVDSRYPMPYSAAPRSKNALNNIAEIFKDVVIDEFKYAGIYIDKDFEVKQAIGNFKAFLNFPDGNFNLNLLKLVQPDLSVAISASVRKAIKDNEKVVMKNVILSDKTNKRHINIVVKPFLEQSEYLQPFLFIVIHEVIKEQAKPVKEPGPGDINLPSQRFMELESELNETKQNLQAVIEELETANEELQSSNEEMISANEELQSTNEELQSLNEELHTVNAEHQLKIKELVELNDDLNNYFSNTEIGQLLIDKKMLIRKFTPSIKSQINLRETDVGRSIVDISNNFKDLDFINDIKTVMKSGEVTEKEVIMNNGKVWQMRISPYLRLNKVSDGVVVTFVDISQVKQLNSLIDGVFNSSVSAITARKAIRDSKGRIKDFAYLAVNKAAERILGLSEKSIGGKMSGLKTGLDRQYIGDYAKVVETGEPLHFEYYAEKERKWYDVSVVKMMDGIVTTHTDITDKKVAADMIAKNFDELKSASKELSSAYTELEQTNFDLMQFASVISHDLKEPLRKIQTFGDRLQVKSNEKLSEEEKKYLDKMIGSSLRMKTLIDDLLLYSKLSNKSAMFTNVDLNKIIHHIQDDLEIQIREKKATINVGHLPVLPAVSGQMHQFFQNLISNSLKFVQSDPVISISQVPVDKKMAKKFGINPEEYACICLKDNGIGFDSKYNEKIFGMFQRLTTEANYPGTGIGLAICKRIAENHNGFVYAQGAPNKGASFFLVLPKTQKKRPEAA